MAHAAGWWRGEIRTVWIGEDHVIVLNRCRHVPGRKVGEGTWRTRHQSG